MDKLAEAASQDPVQRAREIDRQRHALALQRAGLRRDQLRAEREKKLSVEEAREVDRRHADEAREVDTLGLLDLDALLAELESEETTS